MSKSAQRASNLDRPENFQLKGGLFPMNLLDLKTADLDAIRFELTDKVSLSPAFFQHSPLVFGVDHLSESEQEQLDLASLCTLCRELQLLPTAIRTNNEYLQKESRRLGLAILPKNRNRGNDANHHIEETTPPAETSTLSLPSYTAARVVTAPVRSGQQIYARGSDLIVMAAVSAGAEVLADGNIHIYGALRGRALAGVQGDESARIFCSSQEAELVSIAGQFMVDEVLRTNHWKESVQVYLAEGRIQIAPLPKQN